MAAQDGIVIPSPGQLEAEGGAIRAERAFLASGPGFFLVMGFAVALAAGGFFTEDTEYKDYLFLGAGGVATLYLGWLALRWFQHFTRDDNHARDIDESLQADFREEDMKRVN